MEPEEQQRRHQPERDRIRSSQPDQREQADHRQRPDIGQEIERHSQPAPHHRRGQAQPPRAQRDQHADPEIDLRDGDDVRCDAVLNVTHHPRRAQRGAEAVAIEQQAALHPDPRLDHEIGHQQGQKDLDHHRWRGDRHLFQHRGPSNDHLRTRSVPGDPGELTVDIGDPAEAAAQRIELFADARDHLGGLSDQIVGRLDNHQHRQRHDHDRRDQRQCRGEHVGQTQADQPVGQRGEDDGQDNRRDQRQEHHRPDRKHERQSQEQRQPEQEDHGRQQPRDRQSFLHGRIRIGNGRNAGHRRQTLGHYGCKRQPDLSQTRICFTRTRLNRDWSIR